MRHTLRPFRFTGILVLMFLYLVHMSLVWLFVRGRWHRVRWSNRILKLYARLGLKIQDVRVNYQGLENLKAVDNALFVCNHMSYMDVLVIHGLVAACFVTSKEIKETPVLGQVCMLAGCLFVDRKDKSNINNEVREIADGLKEGVNVAIFPEATSTNAEKILRFRRPLYVAAIQSGKPVLPLCLNYRFIGGEPISTTNRDKICWYGDMDFVPHLWSLSGSGGVEADLIFLPPIQPAPDEDATALAERSQRSVESAFRPVQPKS